MSIYDDIESHAELAQIVAEGIRIARECLAGDPFRDAADHDADVARLWCRYDGDKAPERMIERQRERNRPAWAVAGSALSIAQLAGRHPSFM